MNVAERKRRVVLGGALVLTLVATFYDWLNEWESMAKSAPVTAVKRPQPSRMSATKGTADEIAVLGLSDRGLPEVERDIFAPRNKDSETVQGHSSVPIAIPPPPSVPQLAAPLPPPSPPATAPPLPFAYLGKLGVNGQYTVFLSANGKNFVVKTGDVVAQVYRIEEIRPPLLTMTYLPMSIQQTMQIGEAN